VHNLCRIAGKTAKRANPELADRSASFSENRIKSVYSPGSSKQRPNRTSYLDKSVPFRHSGTTHLAHGANAVAQREAIH
jgi:hypothetical protein